MFIKLLLALISYKGLKKMDEKFNKNVNPDGTAQGGKKSGIAWKIILMVVLAVLVLSPSKKTQQIPGAPGAQGYIPPMYNEVKSNRKK